MDSCPVKTGSYYLLLLISISLAVFMATLDGTIVNIALPAISESFSLSSGSVSWVSTIYLLVMAGCVLIFGKISDIIGFKKIFLSGFIIFTVGSFACGLLPDLTGSFLTLVGSRVFQAVGGAMITAIAPAMVSVYIPEEKKGQAMGFIMTVAALGTAIGPTIGGILTQYLSWHWIFFINVPVGIIAVILGHRVIPGSECNTGEGGFDRAGAALIFTGLALLLFGVSEGDSIGWTSPVIIGSLVLSFIVLGLFVRQEHASPSPLLELRLFQDRNFLVLNLILALLFFSFSGINYLLPFYLKYVGEYDTSTAGLILTSLSFAMMIAGLIAGVLYNRFGGRKISILGALVLVAGYYLILHLTVDTTVRYITSCLTLIGLGLGFMVTPVSNMILSSVEKQYQGMASSLTSLERFAPLTIGIAVFNAVFLKGMQFIATEHGVTRSAPVYIQQKVLTAGFDLAFSLAFIIGIGILILAIMTRKAEPAQSVENTSAFL
jgi:EmrB/QacA subfamily drug resistance transporter